MLQPIAPAPIMTMSAVRGRMVLLLMAAKRSAGPAVRHRGALVLSGSPLS
jgi:hypothetical protein